MSAGPLGDDVSYNTARLTRADEFRRRRDPSMSGPSGSPGPPLGGLRNALGAVLGAAGHRSPDGTSEDGQDADYTAAEGADVDAPDPVRQGIWNIGGRMMHMRAGQDAHITDLGPAGTS